MSQPESPLVVPAPAAIGGIGMDLLRIDRIERALARHGDRFAPRPGWDNPALRTATV